MSELQQAIERLKSSAHYEKLATFKPPFNPFEVAGITYRERNHSSVLAWLLGDAANKEFREKFVLWIVSQLDNYNPSVGIDERVEIIPEYGDKKSGLIDVFAHFPGLKLAVGIEVKVKVGQGEEDRQIERYQKILKQKYANCQKVVIFLTPLGEDPETSVKEPEVPVLNMSWGEVAQIIGSMQPSLGEENDLRVQFWRHLRRFILNERDEKQIVRELLCEGDNARILQPIFDNLPTLQDCSGEWKEIVAEVCDMKENDLDLKIYKEQGVAKELQIKVPEWSNAGLPFTLMLYKYDEAAGVRILLLNDDYDDEHNKEQLHRFARTNKGIVNDEFPPAENWNVRAVLTVDGSETYPPGTVIDAEFFYHYKKWKKQVKEKLERQMRPLLVPIKDWLNEQI